MAKSAKSKNDNYDDMKQKKGHKQENEAGEKSAEADMDDVREAEDDDDLGDPFDQMMAKASRDSRYTVAFIPNRGTADPNDPMNATPDEHDNAPKTRKMKGNK